AFPLHPDRSLLKKQTGFVCLLSLEKRKSKLHSRNNKPRDHSQTRLGSSPHGISRAWCLCRSCRYLACSRDDVREATAYCPRSWLERSVLPRTITLERVRLLNHYLFSRVCLLARARLRGGRHELFAQPSQCGGSFFAVWRYALAHQRW